MLSGLVSVPIGPGVLCCANIHVLGFHLLRLAMGIFGLRPLACLLRLSSHWACLLSLISFSHSPFCPNKQGEGSKHQKEVLPPKGRMGSSNRSQNALDSLDTIDGLGPDRSSHHNGFSLRSEREGLATMVLAFISFGNDSWL